MTFFCVSTPLPVWTESILLTRSSSWYLRFQIFPRVLQRFDVTSLAEEEVGSHGLAHNQDTCQQSDTCHLIGTGGAATRKEEAKKGERGWGGRKGERKCSVWRTCWEFSSTKGTKKSLLCINEVMKSAVAVRILKWNLRNFISLQVIFFNSSSEF